MAKRDLPTLGGAPSSTPFGFCLLIALSACSKDPPRDRATQVDVESAAAASSSATVALSPRDAPVVPHGSTKKSLGHGYRVVRVREGGAPPADVVSGFMRGEKAYGRPADVLKWRDGMLVSDDFAGAIYFLGVRK